MPKLNSYRRKRSKRVVRVPAGSSADKRMAKSPDWVDAKEGDRTVHEQSRDGGTSPTSGDGPPPKAGKGSGTNAWAAYADGKIDPVPDKKGDIIAALEAAGVPTDQS